MRIRRTIILILIVILTCSSCDKGNSDKENNNVNSKQKQTIQSLLDFTATDVKSVQITDSDSTQSQSVIKFIRRMDEIVINKKMKKAPDVEDVYDDYKVVLTDDTDFELMVYQNYLKLINKKGKTIWYKIKINRDSTDMLAGKPVIYLYPEKTTEVTVKLDFAGKLTYTYPFYHDGWRIRADTDGTIHNICDGKDYSYLFWEGISDAKLDFSKGFVIRGSDTEEFLQEKLSYLGLTSKEYNEFIVYWAPKMFVNPYNLITFQGTAYTDIAKLSISPEPDSILRVFMAYKPLEHYMKVPEQELSSWKRKGFSVVEWGGTEINND